MYSYSSRTDDLFFQVDSKHFRLYQPLSDPAPIYPGNSTEQAVKEEAQELAEEGSPEFAYEKDLQNYLAKNLGNPPIFSTPPVFIGGLQLPPPGK